MSINRVILEGTVGKVGVLKYDDDGRASVMVSLVTTEHRQRDGQLQEHKDWHQLSFVGPSADEVARSLDPGQSLQVDGRLRVRTYTTGEEKRYFVFVEVHAFDPGRKARPKIDDSARAEAP